jgi:type I restriction enzyme M protein
MREELIKSDLIESIIGIGPNLFYNSPMEACILICNKKKPSLLRKKILFVNALKEITRKNGESYLEKEHIEKISSAFHHAKNIDSFSKVVDLSDIEANDYDLTIQKYVFINDYVDELSESFETYLGKWDVQSTSTSKELSNLIGLLQ